jgi:hypothetical protein
MVQGLNGGRPETMVHEAAATGFERKADAYTRGRPAYHPELVSRVVARCSDEVGLLSTQRLSMPMRRIRLAIATSPGDEPST